VNYFEKNQSFLLRYFSYWENRKQYLELMKKFINGKIDGTQFESEFCEMWRIDTDKIYNLKKLRDKINDLELTKLEGFSDLISKEFLDKINELELTKLKGFSDLISELFTDCDIFQPDPDLRDYYEISEEELRNRVKKTLLQIQEYL
jgi:hypothetical protein